MPKDMDPSLRDSKVRHKRATIIDVAERAGVSRQTVSRVVAGGELVAKDTLERVTTAIEELGYRPNHLARTLVQRRSCILGVSALDLDSPLASPFIERLQALSRPLGYHIIVSNFDLEDEGGAGTLHTFVSLSVDGIALFPAVMEADVIERFARSYDGRIVAVGRVDQIEGVHSLSLDEVAAAQLVVDHLISRGRRRIAVLTNAWYPGVVHPRMAALQATLDRSGSPAVQFVAGYEPDIEGGMAAMTELISQHSSGDIDAVVAYNDTMAFGALHACRTHGLSVPHDVAVVGYDGTPFGAVSDPPLTTVPQDAGRYAEVVFKLLIDDQEANAAAEEPTLIAPRLVVRGSS